MTQTDPGWYPDPEGGQQVRFWDGDGWTEYVQPFAPDVEHSHGPQTATQDYPYLEGADLSYSREPRVVSSWEPVALPSGAMPPRSSRRASSGSSARWWVIGGAAALVLGLVLVIVLRSQPGADPAPVADPAGSDGATATTSEAVTTGAPVTAAIPDAATLSVPVDIAEDGAYLIDVQSDQDVAASLWNSDPMAENDDRGNALADTIGGQWQDPALMLTLTAGSYTVELTEHDGLATDATVSLFPLDTTPVTVGEPAEVPIPTSGYALVAFTVEEPTSAIIDIRSTQDGDLQLVSMSGSSPTWVDDRTPAQAADTGSTEQDPYLEGSFAAGTHMIVVSSYYGDADTASVSITSAS